MVRELADWDPLRAQHVLRWPLREALLAYVERLKAHAQAQYEHAMLLWASIAPYMKGARQPDLPAILRD